MKGSNACEMLLEGRIYFCISIFLCKGFHSSWQIHKGMGNPWDVGTHWSRSHKKRKGWRLGFLLLGDSWNPLKTPVGRLGRVLRLILHPTQEPQGLSLLDMGRMKLEWTFYFMKQWHMVCPLLRGPRFGISAKGSRIKMVQPSSRHYLFLYAVAISGCCKPESSTSAAGGEGFGLLTCWN